MNRKAVLILAFLLFLFCLQYPRFQQNEAKATDGYPVHNLNTGLNYTTIQEAINANETLDGHAIRVDAGSYSGYGGYPIEVKKSISLIGQGRDSTSIIGNSSYDALVVEVDNVTIEGFTVKNGATGVRTFTHTHVANCTFAHNGAGIYPSYLSDLSGGNIIEDNIVANNGVGIQVSTNDTIVFRNKISDNKFGIMVENRGAGPSGGILISENTVENSEMGFVLGGSWNDTIFHNNLVNNTSYFIFPKSGANNWDNGFEGNYWSDYSGMDNDLDGIGDTPYVVNNSIDNIDRFPLMGQFQSFNLTIGGEGSTHSEEVTTVSNLAIGSVDLAVWLTTENKYFKPGQYFVLLTNVTGEEGVISFVRLTIPNNVLNASDYVVVDSNLNSLPTLPRKLPASNTTYTYLYFAFVNPTHELYITIPELPSFLVFPLFMIATLLAIKVYKRRQLT